MKRTMGTVVLAAACGLLALNVRADDDPPPAKKAEKEAPKKDDKKQNDMKAGKPKKDDKSEEPAFNAPPKGQVLRHLGTVKGKITRACDGKVFGFQADKDKKEVEINLSAATKIQVMKKDEFDEKGNVKKNPRRGPVKGTADDIKSGIVVLDLSGTRGGWYVARQVVVLGEGE